jgi:EKC/KEOPS complex subunit CGI121/TPRKB
METYTLPFFPPNVGTVHIAYFEDVANAAAIKQRLIDAARTPGEEGERARAAVDFAFIDADLLVSKQHLLTALLATLLTSLPQAAGALPAPPPPKTRTHNLHSEVLCALSPNNNISDAIRRFGVGEGTRRLVVARYGDDAVPAADVYAMIGRVVQGRLESVGRLDEADVPWGRVDKVYKVAEMNQLKLPPAEREAAKRAAIVNAVAVKHAM